MTTPHPPRRFTDLRQACWPAAVLAVLIAMNAVAFAGQATCRDYLNAAAEDQPLFEGYIFGYVSALMEDRSLEDRTTARVRVRDMANEYCRKRPNDDVANVIRVFSHVAARYSK